MDALATYVVALGLTLAIELPLYYPGLRWLTGVQPRTALAAATLCNLTTHPVIWFGLYPWLLAGTGVLTASVIVEVFAMLAEWAILTRWLGRVDARLLVLSLLANATSFLVGRVVIA